MRRWQSWAVCGVGILLLAGCGRHEQAPATVSAHAATTPAKPAPAHPSTAPSVAPSVKPVAAPDTAFRVTGLTLGTLIGASYAVTTPTTRFTPDTPIIYASVATAGHTAGATLQASWRYLEGNGVLVNQLEQTVATEGPAVTTFKVQNPNRWPVGKYSVSISLDGKVVAQQDFAINDGKAIK